MRVLLFLITTAITIVLCIVLNTKILLPAPLGKLLSPQHGIWQNAEPADHDHSGDLSFPYLKGKVEVSFDDRLVPHIIAEHENDAYFVQGYLHAKYRLWQMELQTLAAAGRASEIVGEAAIDHDREFRRLGMVYAAENSLKKMESDPVIKAECDAYTAGVNSYIETLTESNLPLEYKLIGYYPEKWSNLKSALFLKYMSYDLASHENDFEMTNAKSWFTPEDLSLLFPSSPRILDPIIPRGTVYPDASVKPVPPPADSSQFIDIKTAAKADRENGSNNWAVAGSKTASGSPILCNDPHLGLNLPSLWYEIQITTPEFNAYGVSFPGAPSIIIGFNDSISWGVTNGGRDVRDYYEIQFRDDNKKEYLFNGEWMPVTIRVEKIKIKGRPDLSDTVMYTIHGPVMYDHSYRADRTNGKAYAVRWAAHEPSNELLVFNKLNHAKNYEQYLDALTHMETPGQNFAFASRSEIAMRTQGKFPAKWKGQGDVIMPGTDSSYMWKGMIPFEETPFQHNPERGFVSSANQHPADSTYPYYLGWNYPLSRGIIINRMLTSLSGITPQDMMNMQVDNYNVFAEMVMDTWLKGIRKEDLSPTSAKYFEQLERWNLRNDAQSTAATIFSVVWDAFYNQVYNDDYAGAPKTIIRPLHETLVQGMMYDSAYKFLDDKSTLQIETLHDNIKLALEKATPVLDSLNTAGKLVWYKFQDTRISHLAKLPELSRLHLETGGGTNIINATRTTHGPSWRMVVSMTSDIEAWGIYPGGQSGNPGSRFYDNFVDMWASGKYNKLNFFPRNGSNEKVKWKLNFSKN